MKKFLSVLLCLALITGMSTGVYGMSVLEGLGAGAHHTKSPSNTDTQNDNTEVTGIEEKKTYSATDTIKAGVFAGPVELSGMTAAEAQSAVEQYVKSLGQANIELKIGENAVNVTAADLGISWTNEEIIDEAMGLCKQGNVIKRFKDISDLKRTNKVYPVTIESKDSSVKRVLETQSTAFDTPAEDATLKREDGAFTVVGGQNGKKINVNESAKLIEDYMASSFNGSPASLDMKVDLEYPKGDPEKLAKVKDVLGTFTTKFTSSGKDRVTNVSNGCSLVNGRTVFPGEQLSVLECITPFTEANGYALAGSYLNGVVVESFGGGICQVSTTLYQAVLRAELQVDERHNHSMVVNYVDHSADAAIAESGGKDFKFTNNLEYPIYIEGYTSPEKTITFTIYGVETRDPNRKLSFESVDLETTEPVGEKVIADSSQPAGYAKGQSAHIGYKSEFWKIVKVNGEEKERVKVNSSKYNAVPATLTMGTATSNPVTQSAISAAIATQSIAYCKAVAASVAIDGGASALAGQQAAAPQDAEVAPENTAQGEGQSNDGQSQ
ncbi:MAG: VanW family protein [Lachnospiraceae bacterium]|nr:VanW family protein [Lachnospiraceae bacterium]